MSVRKLQQPRGWAIALAVGLLKPTLRAVSKRTWLDGEKIPATGGCVVVLNHLSHVDPLTTAHLLLGFWTGLVAFVPMAVLLPLGLALTPIFLLGTPFLAAALVTGGRVTIPDWPLRTTQPGDALREIFTAMGGVCELTERGLTFTGTGSVHGIDVDLMHLVFYTSWHCGWWRPLLLINCSSLPKVLLLLALWGFLSLFLFLLLHFMRVM